MAQIEMNIVADSAEDLRKTLAALAGTRELVVTIGAGGSGGTGAAGVSSLEEVQNNAPDAAEQVQRRTRGPNKPKDSTPPAEEAGAKVIEVEAGAAPKTTLQSGVEVPALTYDDDIKPAFLRLAMQKGRERVFAVLAEFGAEKSASEITSEEWPNVLIRVDEELAKA